MNAGKRPAVAGHCRLKLFIAAVVVLYGVVTVIGGMKQSYGE
jgi:hypothetical protein